MAAERTGGGGDGGDVGVDLEEGMPSGRWAVDGAATRRDMKPTSEATRFLNFIDRYQFFLIHISLFITPHPLIKICEHEMTIGMSHSLSRNTNTHPERNHASLEPLEYPPYEFLPRPDCLLVLDLVDFLDDCVALPLCSRRGLLSPFS